MTRRAPGRPKKPKGELRKPSKRLYVSVSRERGRLIEAAAIAMGTSQRGVVERACGDVPDVRVASAACADNCADCIADEAF